MTRTFLAAVVFGLMTAPAFAQGTSPAPLASGTPSPVATPGGIPTADAGISRALKGSGAAAQTGTVTLFRHSASDTLVAVMLDGAGDRSQIVRIVRGTSCDAPDSAVAFALNDTRAGSSVSTANIDLDRLLSGNYDIVTLASTKADAPVTACVHLVH